MSTAFQINAFQINAFQVGSAVKTPTGQIDKGGHKGHWGKISRGPTLGFQMVRTLPQLTIDATGDYILGPDSSVVLVNIDDIVTVVLPLVSDWLDQNPPATQNAFGGGIMVKDLKGTASLFNITVVSDEGIDGVANYVMNQNFQCARFYPLNDLSGWMVG